jgi:hypothetical protein
MKHLRHLLIALTLTSFASSAGSFSRSDFLGVWCSSKDGGKTCFGYDEVYEDGTSDSCGRIPNGGPEFALKLTYKISGNTKCETVVETTHPDIMPVGKTVCAVFLTREIGSFTYRFTSDEPTRIRRSFDAEKSDKWCQHLIDSL